MKKTSNKIKSLLYHYKIHILISIIIILIMFYITPRYTLTKDTTPWYKFEIEIAYMEKPYIFEFNEDNTLTIRTEDLTNIINNNIPDSNVELPINEDQDQCVGYVTITKIDTGIIIDTSKACEIMDY